MATFIWRCQCWSPTDRKPTIKFPNWERMMLVFLCFTFATTHIRCAGSSVSLILSKRLSFDRSRLFSTETEKVAVFAWKMAYFNHGKSPPTRILLLFILWTFHFINPCESTDNGGEFDSSSIPYRPHKSVNPSITPVNLSVQGPALAAVICR